MPAVVTGLRTLDARRHASFIAFVLISSLAFLQDVEHINASIPCRTSLIRTSSSFPWSLFSCFMLKDKEYFGHAGESKCWGGPGNGWVGSLLVG